MNIRISARCFMCNKTFYKCIRIVILFCVVLLFLFGASGCDFIDSILSDHSINHLEGGNDLSYGQAGSDNSLLVIQKGSMYGFIDTTGKVVIKPQFKDARPFFNGLAAVKKNNKWGYIDKSGSTAIPFQYYDALSFHNGKAFVCTDYVKANKQKYPVSCIIDKYGKILKETDYYAVYYCDDENAIVYSRSNSSKAIMINIDYNEFVLHQNAWFCGFSEGLALLNINHAYFFYDISGNQAFDENFDIAEVFSEGLAAVRTDNGKWGYIDKTGKMVIPPIYEQTGSFSEGIAGVVTSEYTLQLIDKSGKVISSEDQSLARQAGKFSEGMCAIRITSGTSMGIRTQYGFIDKTGRIVIDCKYDEVTSFINGVAEVSINGKIGYIDKTGKYIWEPK